jgi:hypothetical protein
MRNNIKKRNSILDIKKQILQLTQQYLSKEGVMDITGHGIVMG